MPLSLENKPLIPRAKVYEPSPENWSKIKDQIVSLENEAFGTKAFTTQEIEADFLNTKNTIVVLSDGERVIGFTYARSLDEADEPGREKEVNETVYIWDTVIKKEYRGRHLVGLIMNELENELRKKGYLFIERVAAVANNYAAGILKHYGDRIIATENRETKYGPQTFFRIRL
jgi:ribosomal protein S18 acetylase RimI-like enzyme